MSESNDFDLISLMVNETFDQVKVSAPLDEKSLDVEKKLNNLIRPYKEPVQLEFEFNFYLGAYDEARSCYIFQIRDTLIECPKNWGPFKLSTYIDCEYEDLFKLKKHEDIDYFFEIVEAAAGKSFESLSCINCSGHLKLIYEQEDTQEQANVVEVNFRPDMPKVA